MKINKFERVNTYMLTDFDDAGEPKYYGYVNDEGEWYIQRTAIAGSVRYHKNNIRVRGLYCDAWNNRTTLQYFYWDTSF